MEWFEFGHIFVLECCDGVRDGNAERFVVESIILHGIVIPNRGRR